jgi:hypothetical protein
LVEELKTRAQAALPAYMVPAAVVVLEALPRTPNGKVDRKALLAPVIGSQSDQIKLVAPRNEKEAILARIWMEVLGLDQVGVFDNFFELGGDSLLSFRVANRASLAGLPLTPRMFFQHNNIAALVNAAKMPAEKTTQPVIGRVSRDAHRVKLPAPQS